MNRPQARAEGNSGENQRLRSAFARAGKRLDIVISEIHQGRHESDTGIYDAQGRFVPEAFEKNLKAWIEQ